MAWGHDHELAGEARRFRLGFLRLRSLNLGSLSLGSLNLGSLNLGSLNLGRLRLGSGLFLFRREHGGLDTGLRRRRCVCRGQLGSGRPGADETGFIADGLGLLLTHVQIS
ncbi:hypothetical protein [Bradyrhizobium sp. AZCC 2289]|uniref:hypothetical protein n=1 Tax=Bradyrhizobium sp. AZCC 2289 TaxID=3117026 RepID=UPI003FA59360